MRDTTHDDVIETITARALVIVDENDHPRASLGVEPDGTCRLGLLDVDGFERVGLTAGRDEASVDVVARARFDQGTRVRLYAHNPASGTEYAIGVHLVVGGNTIAGFEIVEGNPPRVWTK